MDVEGLIDSGKAVVESGEDVDEGDELVYTSSRSLLEAAGEVMLVAMSSW